MVGVGTEQQPTGGWVYNQLIGGGGVQKKVVRAKKIFFVRRN